MLQDEDQGTAFINRQREMADLDEVHDRRGSQFLVVYGRRRIGKTSLLQHWLHGREKAKRRRGFYWVAHRTAGEVLLAGFMEALATCVESRVKLRLSARSWEDAFQQLFDLAADAPLVAVIDEFPYLLESVPEMATLLQKVWDARKGRSQLKLVLCGSQYHMMHEQFFTPKQPLYGRATASLLLEEIAPAHLHEFLPRYSPIQIAETFSIIGGVPKYLEMWDDSRPVLQNVQHALLSPSTLFRNEALFLIQDEIREPRSYLAILQALGNGLKTPVQIAKLTGLAITHVGKYLSTLLELRFVRKVQSAEAPNPQQTRLSRYEIADAFLRFHFEFIHPYPSLVETKRISVLMEQIQARMDSHVGKNGYEELARRHVTALAETGKLSFKPQQIGRAWTPKVEVDVFASDLKSKNALFGECRWTTRKMDVEVLEELVAKADAFARLEKFKKHFMLFSKSGFTAALTRVAKEQSVVLVEGPLIEEPRRKTAKAKR